MNRFICILVSLKKRDSFRDNHYTVICMWVGCATTGHSSF